LGPGGGGGDPGGQVLHCPGNVDGLGADLGALAAADAGGGLFFPGQGFFRSVVYREVCCDLTGLGSLHQTQIEPEIYQSILKNIDKMLVFLLPVSTPHFTVSAKAAGRI